MIGQQFLGEGEAFGQYVAALSHAVDKTQRQRFFSACMASAEDQIKGCLRTDQTRRALRAARARQQAELDFGQAELRAVDRNPVMRGERHFQAAAERGAVNRGDDRLRACFDAVAHVRQRRRYRRFAELANIRTGDEIAARADDQHRLDRLIVICSFDGREQPAPHVGRQRVHRCMVDGHQQHLAAQFACDNVGRRGEGHGCRLLAVMDGGTRRGASRELA